MKENDKTQEIERLEKQFGNLFRTIVYIVLILCAYLLYIEVCEGGGSGDYPYSGSGDWTINQETHIWNESYDISGDLNINRPLYLEENVTLRFTGSNPHIIIDDGFHIYNSTVEGTNLTQWATWDGELFFNHSVVRNVKEFPNNWRENFTAQHSIFYGGGGYYRGIYHQNFPQIQQAQNLTFFNNSFFNFTGYAIYLEPGCNNTTIKNNRFVSCENDMFTYNSTNLTIEGNQYLWYLNIKVINQTAVPVPNATITITNKTGTLLYDLKTNQTGCRSWILINEADNDIRIVASKNNSVLNITLPITHTQTLNITLNISAPADYYLANITFVDDDYTPLEGATIMIYDQYSNQVHNATLGSTGRISANLPIADNSTYFTIEVFFNGKYAYREYWPDLGATTYVFTEFKIHKASIDIHFYNSFTGLGEDSELLRVYYREDGGSWQRSSDTFNIIHETGKVINIEVKDYFNISIATHTLTLSNLIKYHIDFSIPLATIHLENTLGLNKFTVIRQGATSKVQVIGNEFRVIAAPLGNSTIIYLVSWDDTYVHAPNNGTRVLIRNNSFSFPAEASESNPHIVRDLSGHIEAQWEEVITPSAGPEWWEDARVRKGLVIIGVFAAIAFLYARYRWVKERLRRRGYSR
ncbi:MAG: carboxypeptidase regulatory-like domain-containing protein [Thermoplasmata archaeon]|nr:carboxypeptidase regulatory-like domain-containing protein [Thermoplasmata archaeon]